MKLVSLNVEGASQGQIFFDYLKQQSWDTDVFCLQEVFSAPESESRQQSNGVRLHLFKELCEALTDYTGLFDGCSKNHDLKGPVDFEVWCGLAVFVKKPLEITVHTITPIYGDKNKMINPDFSDIARSLQYVVVQTEQGPLNIYNYHGVPRPGDKLDTPTRLENSRKVREVMEVSDGPKILCGDFNLMPETQSVKILEQGMVNLIKKFNITNTRNEISWNKYGNSHQHFADYAFVSPEIKVKSFEVPYNLVSDHLPMMLEFAI